MGREEKTSPLNGIRIHPLVTMNVHTRFSSNPPDGYDCSGNLKIKTFFATLAGYDGSDTCFPKGANTIYRLKETAANCLVTSTGGSEILSAYHFLYALIMMNRLHLPKQTKPCTCDSPIHTHQWWWSCSVHWAMSTVQCSCSGALWHVDRETEPPTVWLMVNPLYLMSHSFRVISF